MGVYLHLSRPLLWMRIVIWPSFFFRRIISIWACTSMRAFSSLTLFLLLIFSTKHLVCTQAISTQQKQILSEHYVHRINYNSSIFFHKIVVGIELVVWFENLQTHHTFVIFFTSFGRGAWNAQAPARSALYGRVGLEQQNPRPFKIKKGWYL